jgi:SAM-dependent methyltransferase
MGCGDGSNLKWLAKYFDTMLASDYNLVRLLRASRLDLCTEVFMADITDYPAANDSLDVIFFNHVLEHIPDDKAALREAFRILKPGGLLVLGVPNEGAFFWQLAYWLQPESKRLSDHVHCYTSATLGRKCREAGFAVQEIRPIGWGVPHWGWDERLRGRKWVDDLFETLGKVFLRSQATSLYLILSKPERTR